MRFSSAVVVCCGADEAEVARRATAIGRDLAELRSNGVCGTPSEVVDRLGQWADAGAATPDNPTTAIATAYLQILDLADLDHLRLIARDVLPALGR